MSEGRVGRSGKKGHLSRREDKCDADGVSGRRREERRCMCEEVGDGGLCEGFKVYT